MAAIQVITIQLVIHIILSFGFLELVFIYRVLDWELVIKFKFRSWEERIKGFRRIHRTQSILFWEVRGKRKKMGRFYLGWTHFHCKSFIM